MKKTNTHASLKTNVLKEIESKNVCPKSKWFFGCKECLFWMLWGLSVFFGALAIGVCYYALDRSQYYLYEATHGNLVLFLFEILPYVWMVLFAIMVLLALYNLRHTKRGYRYSLWHIILSSVILSIVVGFILNQLDFGYKLDRLIGQGMPQYMSQEKLERKLWMSASEGRLVGRQVAVTEQPEQLIIFEDLDGMRWTVATHELHIRDRELLEGGYPIRLVGELVEGVPDRFHACGVFPWIVDNQLSQKDYDDERKAFIDRIYNHMLQAEERARLLENETYTVTNSNKAQRCAEIAIVHRLEAQVKH